MFKNLFRIMVENTTTKKEVYDLPDISREGWSVSCLDEDICYVYNDEINDQENFISIIINNNKYCVDFISDRFKELESSKEFFLPMVAESFIHEIIDEVEDNLD